MRNRCATFPTEAQLLTPTALRSPAVLPLPSNQSTRAVGPTATPTPPLPAADLGSAADAASAPAHYGPNPLWVITAALALFFGVAAAFLAAG